MSFETRLSNSWALTNFISGSRSVMSISWWPHGLQSPWNSPGQNTGVGSHSLLQGTLPDPGIEPRVSHITVWATTEALTSSSLQLSFFLYSKPKSYLHPSLLTQDEPIKEILIPSIPCTSPLSSTWHLPATDLPLSLFYLLETSNDILCSRFSSSTSCLVWLSRWSEQPFQCL